MNGLFVTGTDTGVGKTVVAAAIVSTLRSRGVHAIGCKPVESGVDGMSQADSEVLASVSGRTSAVPTTVYSLRAPAAPAVAADGEGVVIRPELVVRSVRSLATACDAVIVEGIGGVLVPITWEYLVIDLIADLGLPALVVARAGLGTINHTLLTCRALADRGIRLEAVVLNRFPAQPGVVERRNLDSLRRLTGCERVFTLPAAPSTDPLSAAAGVCSEIPSYLFSWR